MKKLEVISIKNLGSLYEVRGKIFEWLRNFNPNNTYYKNNLNEVYKTCSNEKKEAFVYCQKLCNSLEGYNLKIVSHCINNFSVCFEFKHNGQEAVAYITKSNNRFIYR